MGKRIICMLCIGMYLACAYLPVSVNAAQSLEPLPAIEMRATKDFTITISAGSTKSLKTYLPLSSGEEVSIQAYYSPESARVDFGLVSDDGIYHYVSSSNGNVNVSIAVDNPGDYKFAIRNNSSQTITVSGQIKY